MFESIDMAGLLTGDGRIGPFCAAGDAAGAFILLRSARWPQRSGVPPACRQG